MVKEFFYDDNVVQGRFAREESASVFRNKFWKEVLEAIGEDLGDDLIESITKINRPESLRQEGLSPLGTRGSVPSRKNVITRC